MAVSGKELASLDFSNLIGGPLNAVVEAQAKSAISTANFIKQVGFDKDGKVVKTDFSYSKTNADGRKQDFTLSVPFLCLLPIPYIKIDEAIVEFNAKITSTTESSSSDAFKTEIDASAGGSYWFVSAKVSTKTSYQKQSANSDKEERTFDMHVKVTASNTDMPSGTEKILNMLEESMQETPDVVHSIPVGINTTALTVVAAAPGVTAVPANTYTVTKGDFTLVTAGMKVQKPSATDPTVPVSPAAILTTVTAVDTKARTITFAAAVTEANLLID